MCLKYQKTPDDPFISEMDPVLKVWMFQNWLEDQKDKSELTKNHAYLIGSFWNPEAVKELMGQGNVIESTSEEFEESSELVRSNFKLNIGGPKNSEQVKKRRRRTLKD